MKIKNGIRRHNCKLINERLANLKFYVILFFENLLSKYYLCKIKVS